jgi:hypothetical protein
MVVYTCSEARQNLSSVLGKAAQEGPWAQPLVSAWSTSVIGSFG